jgi:hypothetical protein
MKHRVLLLLYRAENRDAWKGNQSKAFWLGCVTTYIYLTLKSPYIFNLPLKFLSTQQQTLSGSLFWELE